MKKLKFENNLVLVLSKSEYIALSMLVASGVCRAVESDRWDDEGIRKFRDLRNELLDLHD